MLIFTIKKEIIGSKTTFLAFDSNNSLIGYVSLSDGRLSSLNKDVFFISELKVLPSFRRNGIASTLMNSVIDEYKSFNSSLPLFLEAEAEQDSIPQSSLVSFYETLGFSIYKSNSHFSEMFLR